MPLKMQENNIESHTFTHKSHQPRPERTKPQTCLKFCPRDAPVGTTEVIFSVRNVHMYWTPNCNNDQKENCPEDA